MNREHGYTLIETLLTMVVVVILGSQRAVRLAELANGAAPVANRLPGPRLPGAATR